MLKLAKHLYTTYINAVGNKSVSGEPLLEADKFFIDPTFKVQSDAWKSVSKAARNYEEANEIVKISTQGAKTPDEDEDSDEVSECSEEEITENDILMSLVPISIQLNDVVMKLIKK